MKITGTVLLILSVTFFSYSQDYRVNFKELTKNSGNPKYEFTFVYPQIKGFNSNVTGMGMFNRHTENLAKSTLDTFKVWMKDWEVVPEADYGSYYEVFDSVYYVSNRLISIQFYENNYFAGAAHPNNSSFSMNYDLEKYREVTLNDLFTPGWVNKISDICIADLREQKDVPPGQENESIQIGAGPEVDNFRVFNITKDGIVITFITYQIGAYVEGPSEVFIPYSKIKELINSGGLLALIAK